MFQWCFKCCRFRCFNDVSDVVDLVVARAPRQDIASPPLDLASSAGGGDGHQSSPTPTLDGVDHSGNGLNAAAATTPTSFSSQQDSAGATPQRTAGGGGPPAVGPSGEMVVRGLYLIASGHYSI